MVVLKNFPIAFGLCILVSCAPSKQIDNGTELENTKWILVEYDGKEYQPREGSEPVTMTLQPERHEVKGFGGCNSFSGSYTHNASTLQFTLVSTKMFCQDNMEVEDYLFKTLVQVEYRLEGDNLIMMNGDGKVLKFIQH